MGQANTTKDEGHIPNLLDGTRVAVTDADGKERMAVVTGINYDGTEAILQASSPSHPDRRFAKVESYVVKTRDAKNEVLQVKPGDIKPLSTNDGWARGQS